MGYVQEFTKLAITESLLSSIAPPVQAPYHQQEAEAFSAIAAFGEITTVFPAGVAGFIPKWTAPTVLGNSIMQELAGNIVVGTDPPTVGGALHILRVGGGARFEASSTLQTIDGLRLDIRNNSVAVSSTALIQMNAANGVVAFQIYADGLGTGPLAVPGGYFGTFTNHPVGLFTNNLQRGIITAVGNLVWGAGSVVTKLAALATGAIDGFLYLPSCAGVPSGVPTVQAGTVPMVIDTTNKRLYLYLSGAWFNLVADSNPL